MCPNLNIDNDASEKYQEYMCHGKVIGDFSGGNSNPELAAFYEKRGAGDDVLNKIFSNKNVIKKYVNKDKFVKTLYYMLISLQGVDVDNLDERNCSLTKVFTSSELASQWQAQNLYWYKDYANCPLNGGVGIKSARFLVEQIRKEADAAIAGNGVAANLRFGHDTGLLPLVATIGINGMHEKWSAFSAHEHWSSSEFIPMASSLQMVFYKNTKGDILVKLLYNEKETSIPALNPESGPYYTWSSLKEYLLSL